MCAFCEGRIEGVDVNEGVAGEGGSKVGLDDGAAASGEARVRSGGREREEGELTQQRL